MLEAAIENLLHVLLVERRALDKVRDAELAAGLLRVLLVYEVLGAVAAALAKIGLGANELQQKQHYSITAT